MTGSAEHPEPARIRLVIAYDGRGFHGFAPNPGVRTVLGVLTDAASLILREPVTFVGAGRTDAGVHAWGQVVSGTVPAGVDPAHLARRLNKLCGPEIAVREASFVDAEFDARFSATSRTYRYQIWNASAPNPLMVGTAWHVPRPLRQWAMQTAADVFLGEHDFTTFCRRPASAENHPIPSLVRRVLDTRWTTGEAPELLRFEITATSFCHQMVRSIVGTLVEVGLDRRSPADVQAMLRVPDRSAITSVAPPHGLILWEVGYAGRRWDHQHRG